MNFLNFLLPTIEHFKSSAYWIIFFISFLNMLAFVGITIPGAILIVLIGFISASGFLDFWYLLLVIVLGSILGDLLSYYFGTHNKLFKDDDNKVLKLKHINKAKTFFKLYKAKSIFMSKFIGEIRPIIPFVAGMYKLNKKYFFLIDTFSIFIWSIFYLFIGFLLGQVWNVIMSWSTRIGIFIISFISFIIIFYALDWIVIKKGKQFLIFIVSISLSIKKAIVNNEYVKKFIINHPHFSKFIKDRLNREKFSGLTFTILSLTFLYALSLLLGVSEDIFTSNTVVNTDMRILNLLRIFRNANLTKFFLLVTLLGKWQIILIFLLSVSFLLWIWNKKEYIYLLLISTLGSGLTTLIGKYIFHRARPMLPVYTEHSFSFPSGHATIAMSFYGFLAFILIHNVKKWKTKVNIFFAGILIILLIGFSRLYLGVHFASDVWAGYLVGLLWIIISLGILYWKYPLKEKNIDFKKPKKYIAPTVVILISALFYIGFAINYHPQKCKPQISEKDITIQSLDDIFSNKKSKYTETIFGRSQEPISFIIFAKNDNEFIKLFTNSGWFLSDKIDKSSIIKLAKAAISDKPYPRAPMVPSFWNNQVHTFGFEKPTKSNNIYKRHHARFWRTNYITQDNRRVYIGTASLDQGIKWWLVHRINPDIDTEREFLFNDLKKSNMITCFEKEKFVKPILGKNFCGDSFFTDGKIYKITL